MFVSPLVRRVAAGLALVAAAASTTLFTPRAEAAGPTVLRSSAATCYRDVEGGGLPIVTPGSYSAYMARPGSTFARSESIYGTGSGCLNGVGGQTMSWRFTSRLSTGMSRAQGWQVISQLHGPSKNNVWYGPAVSLVVEDGYWKLAGGWNAPDGRGGQTARNGYSKRIMPAVDNVSVTWQLTVVLGGPGKGSVSLWRNGVLVINEFKPGAGTTYSGYGVQDHKFQQVKIGLYSVVARRATTGQVSISGVTLGRR